MRATVARLGREAAWLSPQQGIGSCLHAATAVGASRACLGAEVVRTVAMLRPGVVLMTYEPSGEAIHEGGEHEGERM